MVLRQATRMTRLATMRNPVGQFFRNRTVGLLTRLPPFRRGFVNYLSEMSVHYPHSPLNGESGDWSSGVLRPGDRVPDTRLREAATSRERRLLSVLRGPRHHLLLLPADAAASLDDIRQRVEAAYPDLIRVHRVLPGHVPPAGGDGTASVWLDPEGAVRRSLGAREAALALVRPDGYLGYRGQPAAWDGLRGYLDRYLIAQEK
jgi:hypothetical protein